jgi:hypothetical protein
MSAVSAALEDRMKHLPLLGALAALCCACEVMPDTADTTNPTLRMRIHYQRPGIGTPSVEITADQSVEANRCVYVASPFGVSANVADSGGVRSVIMGPSAFFDALSLRQQSGDLVAIPSPTVATQPDGAGSIPNPGSSPDSNTVRVSYSAGKVFDTVNLLATYEFKGSPVAALRATARNFGATTGVAEVYHFYVRPSGSGPSEQPGMACLKP